MASLQGVADRDRPPGTLDLCARTGGTSDPEWLISSKGFSYSDVVLVNPKSGAPAFLYRGANANDAQPYEVQPSISPNGRWVVIKDARRRNVIAIEINQKVLGDFLRV